MKQGTIKLKNKKKIALVLSGGGVKAAAFHVGVCIALREKGFRFIGGTREEVDENPLANDPMAIKLYVGSSAGAFISALLASGHSLEDIVDSFQMGAGLLRKPREKSRLKPMNYFDIFSANRPSIEVCLKLFFKKDLWLQEDLKPPLKIILKLMAYAPQIVWKDI
jgi:predicted acylesterase/phospholipase RssA